MDDNIGIIDFYYVSNKGKVIYHKIIKKNMLTMEVIVKSLHHLNENEPVRTQKFNFPTEEEQQMKPEWYKFNNEFKQPKLNIPHMIRCQNCETNYPTKYQYQRHQCEFNAEKVVLKPNIVESNIKEKTKFECNFCSKKFVTKNNLERHRITHENPEGNVCEFCKKQFVSENRLRIHKENHCKKSGDINKFYRSDVNVWRCKKCYQVFSSNTTASYHLEVCLSESDEFSYIKQEPVNNDIEQYIEKISTEILLQCEFCNRTYADKNILMRHQRTHQTDKNYECINCMETFPSYILASQHWLKKCSEKTSLFYLPKLSYCEFCDRTFKSHETLYAHKIKKSHYIPKLHGIVDKKNESPNKFDKLYTKLVEDVLHELDVKSKNLYNLIVEDIKQEQKNAIESSQSSHEPSSVGLAQSTSLEPEKKKRGRKRKICMNNDTNDNDNDNSNNNNVDVSNNENLFKKGILFEGYKYQCERCVSVFDKISELESHRKKYHATSYSCNECGQVVNNARALLIHSRLHKSLKPYVCDTCGRSYSQTSHLWQHMRFHQGIKPFACPHEGCEARYTIRPDLKDHIRKVHTRERPFKCNVCGKCFLTGSVYYQHRLIHTEDRRYSCNMCDKKFFRADALNNHKRIHTNERPYPCFICGRLFRQKGDRNKHVRTQHPESVDK